MRIKFPFFRKKDEKPPIAIWLGGIIRGKVKGSVKKGDILCVDDSGLFYSVYPVGTTLDEGLDGQFVTIGLYRGSEFHDDTRK